MNVRVAASWTRLIVMAAVLAAALAVMLTMATGPFGLGSAQAGGCDIGDICLWKNKDYDGCKARAEGNRDNYKQWHWANGCSGDPNDEASSVKARGASCGIRLFEDVGGLGKYIRFDRYVNPPASPTYNDPNLDNNLNGEGPWNNLNWNDRISSHEWC
jgi:hypothetical protein